MPLAQIETRVSTIPPFWADIIICAMRRSHERILLANAYLRKYADICPKRMNIYVYTCAYKMRICVVHRYAPWKP